MPKDNSVLKDMLKRGRAGGGMMVGVAVDGKPRGDPPGGPHPAPDPVGAGAAPGEMAANKLESAGSHGDVQHAYDQAQEALQVLAGADPRFGKLLEELDEQWTEMQSGSAREALGREKPPAPAPASPAPSFRGSARSSDGVDDETAASAGAGDGEPGE